ncbi:hypothetical protein BAE44_0018613 [Dichanthelium oligosanthes]|uniref:C2H2-type domain-containing protein n=1 Tax=Dichanthelium oligosanthes TaxID=888268 RepID=A0A1E5V5J2_9POAL|nr:hypothetical protein BAE44_0018613 [Dichanthelium oligosanthes]
MASSSSPPPRRLRHVPDVDDLELEEGQFVPASEESSPDTDDGDGRYLLYRYPSRREDEARGHPQHGHRSLIRPEYVLALGRGDALPSPTPSSDGTISDEDANLSPASVFSTTTDEPKRGVALHGGWAATGRRGWTGSKPAAARAPLNNAQSSHSNSNLSGDSSSAQAVVVHQPPAPPPMHFAEQAQLLHQPASPPPPSPALLHLAQVAQHPAAPPPPAQPQLPQLVLHQHAADRPRREYTCKECGKSFPTNQALGGHVAGHRTRQREAEAAAAAAGTTPLQDGDAALRRGSRAEAPHECRKCHKVFNTGVQLGGHMRVHYTGPPIVPFRKNRKRGLAPPVEDDTAAPPGLSLALSIKTEEAPPSPAPAGAGRVVRLFGVDISPQVQAPSEQQPFDTTEDFSSAGGQQ